MARARTRAPSLSEAPFIRVGELGRDTTPELAFELGYAFARAQDSVRLVIDRRLPSVQLYVRTEIAGLVRDQAEARGLVVSSRPGPCPKTKALLVVFGKGDAQW